MQLFYAQTSPFVRKVLVIAHELDIADRIEKRVSGAHPVDRVADVVRLNPLGKIPLLVIEDGRVLYDSSVICEYLDATFGGSFFPRDGRRWEALTLQALADGMLDACMLARYERVARSPEKSWQVWIDAQLAKVWSGLSEIELTNEGFAQHLDIGTVTVGCMLGYLDFRFPTLDWRKDHPRTADWYGQFSQRDSMKATVTPPPNAG